MKIGIFGCCGRVGTTLLQKIYNRDVSLIAGGVENISNPNMGRDIGEYLGSAEIGVKITSDLDELIAKSDVLIDFSTPDGSMEHIERAVKAKKPIVVGTTGFSEEQEKKIEKLSEESLIVKSFNMSLGVNLLFKLVETAAEILNDYPYDVEIVETHHSGKKDSPSGTALAMGSIIAKTRKADLKNLIHPPRRGITAGREIGKIGFSSIRGGNVVGEHSVLFMGDNETIELRHVASNRSIYVNGAIKAAIWAFEKKDKKGLYSLKEVFDNK